jgi:hypothetical protein
MEIDPAEKFTNNPRLPSLDVEFVASPSSKHSSFALASPKLESNSEHFADGHDTTHSESNGFAGFERWSTRAYTRRWLLPMIVLGASIVVATSAAVQGDSFSAWA